MATITLRVLHGPDRGRVFSDVATPVTIGREEGNSIQLNDERISRYHLKLQDDHEKVVVTDLESTNGTRVNGEDIEVRVVRAGDIIQLGKSTLLVGSRTDIDERISAMAARHPPAADGHARQLQERLHKITSHPVDAAEDVGAIRSPLRATAGPPPLPDRLSPAQSAELIELIEYVHRSLRDASDGLLRVGPEKVELDYTDWQALLDLQARLAELLRDSAQPKEA